MVVVVVLVVVVVVVVVGGGCGCGGGGGGGCRGCRGGCRCRRCCCCGCPLSVPLSLSLFLCLLLCLVRHLSRTQLPVRAMNEPFDFGPKGIRTLAAICACYRASITRVAAAVAIENHDWRKGLGQIETQQLRADHHHYHSLRVSRPLPER